MPPDAISERSSNCRSCIGIIIGTAHFVHGVFSSGARSPEMNTLAPQCGQATSLSELRAGCIVVEARECSPGTGGDKHALLRRKKV